MSRTRHRRAGMIAAAAQTACLMDVMAPKPGNVGRGRDLPGLTYRDFVLSAYAIGPAFRRHARGRTGRLILEAIRTTRRHVATNTNLGIVLLLAPLARAAAPAVRPILAPSPPPGPPVGPTAPPGRAVPVARLARPAPPAGGTFRARRERVLPAPDRRGPPRVPRATGMAGKPWRASRR